MEENKSQLIGIFSWFWTNNAGTNLQAYALQQFINSIPNYKAEYIRFAASKPQLLIVAANGRGLKPWLIRKYISFRKYRFCSFVRKNISQYPSYSQKPLQIEDLAGIKDRYDQFLLGSDQIWNTKITNFEKTFFLDFVQKAEGKRKGAYAPSIGLEDWPDEQKEEIKRLLADFDFIGVREKQNVKTVQNLTDKPVHWSLDPTFLMDKNEWEKIARTPKNPPKGEYIFEYCITKSAAIRSATEKLAKMTGLPIIEYGGVRKRVPSAKRMPHPSADTWLGYLMNAKYVITDSFHGCAMSINMNKTFFVLETCYGSRIHCILDFFGLNDRLLKNDSDLNPSKQIDWTSVNQILEEKRNECKEWLKSSIMG